MVSGSEKRRRRRDAAAAAASSQPDLEPATQEPAEWRHMHFNGQDVDIPFRTFAEGPPAALPVDSQVYRTRGTVVEQAVITMMQECGDELWKDWAVAKARVGVGKAGKTLEAFTRKNTKLIPLDPWDHTPAHSPIFATGSSDPLTMDLIYVVSGAEPTSTPARLIVNPERNMAMHVAQKDWVFRKGEWIVWGMPPTPGEGRELERWETVGGVTARYEAPFVRETRVL
ncbi:unnamed protein product [Peniophora sp. CBMAI 1063]|nr:unnamed protein product [Peniophora sp. CBMAI 1063]